MKKYVLVLSLCVLGIFQVSSAMKKEITEPDIFNKNRNILFKYKEHNPTKVSKALAFMEALADPKNEGRKVDRARTILVTYYNIKARDPKAAAGMQKYYQQQADKWFAVATNR